MRTEMRRLGGRRAAGAAAAVFLLGGCRTAPPPAPVAQGPASMAAVYAATPIVLDGKLDDAAWQKAPAYPIVVSRDVETRFRASCTNAALSATQEPGEVRICWNETFLYIGARLTDSDIVAQGDQDQLHHYMLGDALEVFLKPENETWYWELYGTPTGKKTAFFWPGRGWLGLPTSEKGAIDFKAAASCDGTANKWEDRDRGWCVELAIPAKALTEHGEAWGVGAAWRLLVGRYNYSRYLSNRELAMAPPLRGSNFHLIEEYGKIEFVK
jgi:hypothetical protein